MKTNTPAAHRLFTAFNPALESSLESAIKRTKIGAQQREMEVYWVPRENYHVTLNFLGDTPTDKISELESLISDVSAGYTKFSTSLRGMGAFPDSHHARALWVGVRNSRTLSELQWSLKERLIKAGFIQEDREYLPHLTIGRLRKARSVNDLLSPYIRTSFNEAEVESIALYESFQHGPYSTYKILKTFMLGR